MAGMMEGKQEETILGAATDVDLKIDNIAAMLNDKFGGSLTYPQDVSPSLQLSNILDIILTQLQESQDKLHQISTFLADKVLPRLG